jgi:Arc/MetJ family transcription regulator
MKTTIEIADALLARARAVAAREKTTVRALVEAGLREQLKRRQGRAAFELRDASFGGMGLQPGAPAHWDGVRDLAYEGRGA